MKHLISFLRDQSGVTSIEYAMIASGISVAIITAVSCLSTEVKRDYLSIMYAMR